MLRERRRAEVALDASDVSYRLLFESNPNPMWIYDAETLAFLAVNDAAVDVYGWSREEFLALTIADIRVPEEVDRLHSLLANEPDARGLRHAGLWRHRRKDGSELDVEIRSHDHVFEGRKARVVTSLDVTERLAAEQALRVSEERYRELFENASDLISTADLEGRLLDVNEAFVSTVGYRREELIGKSLDELVPPEGREQLRQARERKLGGAASTIYEHELLTRDGERVQVEVASRLIERDGVIVGTEAICRNITERRRLEHELRQAQRLEAIGRLAGGIAHDFNNLLTAIRSYSELVLEDEGLAAQHRDDVREIQKASDRAAALVRQLLAFSRRQPMQSSAVELDGVVRDMDAMLRRLIGAEFTLDLRAAAPGARVRGDRAQLEQVVLNLVLNARDAMPEGGAITVATALRDGPDDSAWVELTVRDTGVGMDAATRARVFEPFFTTKAPGAGTGLGLATVYGAVQQAGGEVEVESEPGAGTTFRVRLPRVAVGAPTPAPQPAVAPPRGETPTPHGTVLLADDEASLRHAAARLLHRAGYTVLEAEHGGHALALWQEHRERIGLLLTDMRMPVVGGVELAERLRAEQPTLPVIFMSAFSDELDARARRTVPDALRVAKPFEVRAFVETVHEAMSKAAVGGAP